MIQRLAETTMHAIQSDYTIEKLENRLKEVEGELTITKKVRQRFFLRSELNDVLKALLFLGHNISHPVACTYSCFLHIMCTAKRRV